MAERIGCSERERLIPSQKEVQICPDDPIFSDATWRRGTMVKLGCALALASLIISNAETEADLFKDLHA